MIMTKNLSIRPHSDINLGELLCDELFNAICNLFVLLLRPISASKVTIVQPRAESAVHIEFSRC